MAIFTGALWLIGWLLMPETYAPVLLRKRAAKLTKITGQIYSSKLDAEQGKVTAAHAFKTNLSRPWILLFREPIVFLLSVSSLATNLSISFPALTASRYTWLLCMVLSTCSSRPTLLFIKKSADGVKALEAWLSWESWSECFSPLLIHYGTISTTFGHAIPLQVDLLPPKLVYHR